MITPKGAVAAAPATVGEVVVEVRLRSTTHQATSEIERGRHTQRQASIATGCSYRLSTHSESCQLQ